MKKPLVGVVFGSRSTEHDISVLTAIASVITPLRMSSHYDVLPIYISKAGRWYVGQEYADISLYRSGNIDKKISADKPVSLLFDNGLKIIQKQKISQKIHDVDIIFPATHGTHGEDGELMAVCEMANVPYVGCNVPASVLSMDKVLAKQIAASVGVNVTKFVAFAKTAYESDPDSWVGKINKDLTYPLFVKPAHLGSSIGITMVRNPSDLANSIEVALHYDSKALVEEGVSNLVEVTLPIMGNDELTPALLEQPSLKTDEFFDFETKYMQGGKKGKGKSKGGKGQSGAQGYSTIPADLPTKLYDAAIKVGLETYAALGCTGTARVDMLIDTKSKKVYFNEVNPLPGSLYAHNWAKAGVSNVALVEKLLTLALDRHQSAENVQTGFKTNYLQQF